MFRQDKRTMRSTQQWFCGIVAALMGLALLVGTSHAQVTDGIYRVALSGSDVAGCGTSAQPCQNAYYAVLQAIRNGTYTGEIRIAGGTYTQARPGYGTIIPINVYPSNLRITGGYSTNNWNVSNPTANPTILDGQDVNRGILISVDAATSPNCNITITNLTITRGRGTADDPSGGGILINSCGNARVSTVTVQNSVSRGADNTNAGGTSAGTGGGISVRGDASKNARLTLSNVTLANNQAIGGNENSGARAGLGVGGGLFAINATVVATDLTVTDSLTKAGDAPGQSGNPGGQLADGIGGGITAIDCPLIQLDGLTITNNTVRGGNAGGIGGYALGGGIALERVASATISNSTISGNEIIGGNATNGGATSGGSEGGGIQTTGTALTLTNVALLNNSATTGTGAVAGQSYGGGLFMTVAGNSSSLNATNVVVAANSVSGSGLVAGGGIGIRSTTFDMSHLTLANNVLSGSNELGQAIFFQASATSGTLRNSITSGHTGQDSFYGEGGASATISRLMTNDTTTALIGGSGITSQNLITGNPNFISPGSPNYNYRIGFGSAAMNQATGSTVTFDIDQQPRPIGSAADLGADEYQIALTTTANNGSIGLDWDAPAGATVTSYQVQYTKSSGASNATEGATPIVTSSTQTPMSGLTVGATYTITVVAFNGGNEVARSRTVAVIAARNEIALPLVVN
jgi:Fibronectin type III domain